MTEPSKHSTIAPRMARGANGTHPAPAERRIDRLEILSGSLGPVAPCKLEVRPLTVFVGRQGTGKSLVAQVLYALDELPFLAQYVTAQERKKPKPDLVFARIVDQLRSAERRFAGFASGKTRIRWQRGEPWAVPVRSSTFDFTMYEKQRWTRPSSESQKLVAAFAQSALRPIRHAVFVPTERMVISQLRSALAEKVLALPITYELFADWLDRASVVHDDVQDPSADMITELARDALGGQAIRRGDQWKWIFPNRGRGKRATGTLDLDMASSGQRANWSLAYLARSLYALRKRRDFASELTVFVEEPELHLHPAAEVAMSKILAILVNSGIRVVVTTHSLNILYSLNNLLLARRRFGHQPRDGVASPSMRLSAEDVSVYGFITGAPRNLVNRSTAFIDEHELGDVGAELGSEMNWMMNVESSR